MLAMQAWQPIMRVLRLLIASIILSASELLRREGSTLANVSLIVKGRITNRSRVALENFGRFLCSYVTTRNGI